MQMKEFLKRHSAPIYFVLAYLLSWLVWIPVAAAYLRRGGQLSGGYLVIAAIGLYGPAIAALIMTGIIEGKEGLRRLLSKCLHRRVGRTWFAIVLLGYPALYVGATALYIGLSGARPSFHPETLFRIVPVFLMALPLGPLGEELGWRGFVLPRLQCRYGALYSSLILGVFWFLWRLPALMVPGMALPNVLLDWQVLLNYALWIVGLSFLFTMVYNRTDGSVLIAILLHTSVSSAAAVINPLFWGKASVAQIVGINWVLVGILWLVILGVAVLPQYSERVRRGNVLVYR